MYDIIADLTAKIEQTKRIILDTVSYVNNTLETSQKKQTTYLKNQYNERVQLAKDYMNTEVDNYQAGIEEINAQIKALTPTKAAPDYADQINRLNEYLKYENDSFKKYEIQKEITELQKEWDIQKEKERLNDEKEALKLMIQTTKDLYSIQVDLYKSALNEQLAAIGNAVKSSTTTTNNNSATYISSSDYERIMQTVQNLATYYNNSQSINVYQTVTSTAQTPSQLAKEMVTALENMLKYGY